MSAALAAYRRVLRAQRQLFAGDREMFIRCAYHLFHQFHRSHIISLSPQPFLFLFNLSTKFIYFRGVAETREKFLQNRNVSDSSEASRLVNEAIDAAQFITQHMAQGVLQTNGEYGDFFSLYFFALRFLATWPRNPRVLISYF
jgi:hypothetical protein